MDPSALTTFAVGAIAAEAVWETGKMAWQGGKVSVDRVGAMAVGLVVSVGGGLDLFAAAGIPIAWPVVGSVLTGIIISRGANFVHDLFAQIGGAK